MTRTLRSHTRPVRLPSAVFFCLHFSRNDQPSLPQSLYSLLFSLPSSFTNMATWADIAAKNAPPPSEQPHPDQALLEGHTGEAINEHPDGHGVTVVPHDFREHPETVAKEFNEKAAEEAAAAEKLVKEEAEKAKHEAEVAAKKAEEVKEAAKKEAAKLEREAASIFNKAKALISQPKVFVPIISAFDVALIGFLGYKTYIHDFSRRPFDRKVFSAITIGVGAIAALEGLGFASYFSKRDYNGKRK
ncbi:hypothetical protein [Phaffia rhodozyma]|uniref:Mitochondrial outer membrane protein OM14 C-terminal domain-containing protein n=1 Tax=Phaffia rhodozyma TaxID=264483 RepID=A0A0F7SME8_PHARH|nr:hypothetical protein [Phaffia rhodozyma]